MSTKPKQKRKYKRVTPSIVAQHKAAVILHGNDSAAVRATDPEYGDGHDRGHYIAKKSEQQTAADFIDNALEQIAEPAMQRVSELVQSRDERIATKNAHFVIEHIRGKAVQRNISLTGKLNIQSVLD